MDNICNESWARSRRPGPERVLQFGEGRFLRAFATRMVDEMNEALEMDWGVCVVQPRPGCGVEALNRQDGLYTVWLRGMGEHGPVERLRLIRSVTRGLDPYRDFEGLMACARSRDLKVVVSNTTEAGIVYRPEDRLEDAPPLSFPGKVTRLLWERYQAFHGVGGGLIFLPCELIEHNGDALLDCVRRHAAAWALGEPFLRWLEEEHIFANTLVDQIVTGYPEADADAAFTRLGYRDALLDAAEPDSLWVIEGPDTLPAQLPLAQAGCPVVFTRDVEPYRLRKVSMLNGPHTAMAAVGLMAGQDTVGDCMGDPALKAMVEALLFREIMPAMGLEQEREFAYKVLQRYRNPYNRHMLASIAMNSASKFRARLLTPLKRFYAETGRLPRLIVLSMAALCALYGQRRAAISEDAAILNAFAPRAGEGYACRTRRLLADGGIWGEPLDKIPGLAEAVGRDLEAVEQRGMARALEAAMEEARDA